VSALPIEIAARTAALYIRAGISRESRGLTSMKRSDGRTPLPAVDLNALAVQSGRLLV
jgi:hypothetical protein